MLPRLPRLFGFLSCFLLLTLLLTIIPHRANTQVIPPNIGSGAVGGVYIDTEGVVRQRQLDPKELTLLRTRAAHAAKLKTADEPLAYISLPRLLAAAQTAVANNQPIPDDVRFLGGLTQLRYIFVFPEQNDLVIAGPAEPLDHTNKIQPLGKLTGRPALHLDDLIVALRTIDQPSGRAFFGCSLDITPDALKKGDEVARKYANRSAAELKKLMAQAIGPQTVSIINTPDNTHLAFIMIAADYKLKRYAMGLEPALVPGLPSAMDSSRSSACRFWFSPDYQPLLVSADGNAFALRGQRLKIETGAQSFDPRGATEKAQQFARIFTEKFPVLAASVTPFAELQNITDLAVLASLIRHDKLDQRIGWDLSWATKSYPIETVPVPRTADTVVALTSNSIAYGGVSISVSGVVKKTARQADDKNSLAPLKSRPDATAWLLSPPPAAKTSPVKPTAK